MNGWRVSRHNDRDYGHGCLNPKCTWWVAHRQTSSGRQQHNFRTHERALTFVASQPTQPEGPNR